MANIDDLRARLAVLKKKKKKGAKKTDVIRHHSSIGSPSTKLKNKP
tara:strand:- start:435 stop:572 length:138 start_codon:yes stop_codon:yes gene_type:complete